MQENAGQPPEAAHSLPWFGQLKGFALIPSEREMGSLHKSSVALITLSESSQMMVFDLDDMHPLPLSMPFQELSTASVSTFKAPGSGEHGNKHFVTLNRLRVGRPALQMAMHC